MLHLTVVEGEGLTPDIDYVKRSEERLRVGIANDKSRASVILDFRPEGQVKIKLVEDYSLSKLAPKVIFEGDLNDFVSKIQDAAVTK